MPKMSEDATNTTPPPAGRWMWSDETETVEFVSASPAEEGVLKKRTQTNVDFIHLQQRSEWLAGVCTVTDRGRQRARKSLNQAHLSAYRTSVTKRRGDFITTDDVKQVAVSLLQENYSLPIPFGFLAVLKRKELDEVLAALLLYLTCFFEHKSLENKPLKAVDIITEHQMMAEALAKKEISQKKLAVRYFSLTTELEMEQHQRASCRKSRKSSNSTDWLLHACLYSFFCYVAWVAFGRKDLRDIQEEVGRLLYSDTFIRATRSSGATRAHANGSLKTGEADPKERGCKNTLRRRTSHRGPALSSLFNQRSPLMVSLLPTPKEQSPHLFVSGPARRQKLLQAELCDTRALTEELNQQLASASFGIVGKPLRQFSRSTLMPHGEQKANRDAAEGDPEAGSDVYSDGGDRPGVRVPGSSSSFTGPRLTGLSRPGSTTHVNTAAAAASGAQ